MELNALLLCRDPEALQIICNILQEMQVEVEVCDEPVAGWQRFMRHRFDGLVIDCADMQDGPELLKAVRKSTCNRTSVVFALVRGQGSFSPFDLGANFVLDKPLSPDRARRSLRAARSLMLSEHRRYFRVGVDLAVHLSFGQQQNYEVRAASTNISEGGIAIRVREPLEPGRAVLVSFDLPGTKSAVDAKGEVAWSDGEGRAGIRFRHIPLRQRQSFEAWLMQQAK